MKHYRQLDTPSPLELDTLLAEGWEFYSEQTQFVVSQHWDSFMGNNHRGDDRVTRHWLVTLVKEDSQ